MQSSEAPRWGGGGHGLARIIEFYRIIEFLEILV